MLVCTCSSNVLIHVPMYSAYLISVLIYELLSLRYINPNIKLMIGVGGPDVVDEAWTNMTSYAEYRNTFVWSTTEFLKHFDLDGVDLSWFYPNAEGRLCPTSSTFPQSPSSPLTLLYGEQCISS